MDDWPNSDTQFSYNRNKRNMIVSATPGRVRFRRNGFPGSTMLPSIVTQLKQKKGINKVTINHNSGSVLVHYDAGMYSVDQVVEQIRESLALTAIKPVKPPRSMPEKITGRFPLIAKRTSREMRNGLNSGLIASLAISMLAIMGKNKKLHTQAGLAFLGLVAKHLLDQKNRILR